MENLFVSQVESGAPQWIYVTSCPACGCSELLERGRLQGSFYLFGNEKITFPAKGIDLVECRECGLVFKTTLPSPSFLKDVFVRQKDVVWQDNYPYLSEAKVIADLMHSAPYDLLDAGASDGGLLKACSSNMGRRSALDIIKLPSLDTHVKGEFINGFLDDAHLTWSNRPYDVVTAFDTLEHLYAPAQAFNNLKSFVKVGGCILAETGNINSLWPNKYGFSQWYYTRLFEHHMFWSERSLAAIAKKHGLELVDILDKKHKNKIMYRYGKIAKISLKVGFYMLWPTLYNYLAEITGKHGNQPQSYLAKDHIRVALRRVQ